MPGGVFMKQKGEKLLTGAVLVFLIAAFAYYTNPTVQERRALEQVPLGGGSERDNRPIGEIDLVRLYPSLVLRLGPTGVKNVALTFDDGPDMQYTPQVLDVLRDKGVKATFFLIGNRVEDYPDVAKRIVEEGHLVGNHTYSHPEIMKATGAPLQKELASTEQALSKIGASGSGLFRPPYGAISPNLVEEAASLGYRIAMWSVDSLDWRGLPKDTVVAKVMEMMSPGAVVLQHSSGGPGEDLSGSVQALPVIIDTLKEQGYTFVRMDEMFPAAPASNPS